jgi:hypothetical protein
MRSWILAGCRNPIASERIFTLKLLPSGVDDAHPGAHVLVGWMEICLRGTGALVAEQPLGEHDVVVSRVEERREGGIAPFSSSRSNSQLLQHLVQLVDDRVQ